MCVYVCARGVGRREMGGVVGVFVRGAGGGGWDVEVEVEDIVVEGEGDTWEEVEKFRGEGFGATG